MKDKYLLLTCLLPVTLAPSAALSDGFDGIPFSDCRKEYVSSISKSTIVCMHSMTPFPASQGGIADAVATVARSGGSIIANDPRVRKPFAIIRRIFNFPDAWTGRDDNFEYSFVLDQWHHVEEGETYPVGVGFEDTFVLCPPITGKGRFLAWQNVIRENGQTQSLASKDAYATTVTTSMTCTGPTDYTYVEPVSYNIQTHPTWGHIYGDSDDGFIVVARGEFDPLGPPPMDDLTVWKKCLTASSCDTEQEREGFIVNGIGGAIKVYLAYNEMDDAAADPNGYTPGRFGAVISYDSGNQRYYELIKFDLILDANASGSFWNVGGDWEHKQIASANLGGGGSGSGGGGPCFPSPLNNWCNGGGPGN